MIWPIVFQTIGNNRENWRIMGDHSLEYHFNFEKKWFLSKIHGVWKILQLSNSIFGFCDIITKGEKQTEFWRSYILFFSLKVVLGYFWKSQQKSALSELSGNSKQKFLGGGFHTPGEVGLISIFSNFSGRCHLLSEGRMGKILQNSDSILTKFWFSSKWKHFDEMK